MNPLLLMDGYKLSHRAQFPRGIRKVYSNFTPRGSRIPGQETVGFLGLQYFIKHYLTDALASFFAAPDPTPDLESYARRVNAYLGPNNVGTDHIRALWELGYIPLEFRAIPEGSYVPLRFPVLTVENTHPAFFWLTNYYETLLSCVLWMPMTSMTTAGRLRQLLDKHAKATGTDPAFVDFQAHDFSFRGMAGLEAAQLSGIGHLVHFRGTDTIPAIDFIEDYYGQGAHGALPPDWIGNSVPASEHSVMSAGGKETEQETFTRFLDLYPYGIVSIVSDTWNLWDVLTKIIPSLKDRILARPGKVVLRPDSGSPVNIICGDPEAPPDSPAYKGVIELLWDIFGGTTTATSHRLLDSHIGAIYGDSINYDRADAILTRLAAKGFASGNIVFGIGSWSYQLVTRDTYNLAMKATWAEINGEGVDLWKAPVTDDGMKFSAKGRLAVLERDGRLVLVEQATPEQEAQSVLQPVWRNGHFLRRVGFDAVRTAARAARMG